MAIMQKVKSSIRNYYIFFFIIFSVFKITVTFIMYIFR